jgi:GLPGLI family protein
MKTYLLIALYLAFSMFSEAQNIQGVIKYRYKTIENIDGAHNYNVASYLYFNKTQSLYVVDRIKDMEEKDKLEKSYRDVEYAMKVRSPNVNKDTLKPFKRKRDDYGQQYFKDNATQTFKVREFIERKPFVTEEPIPNIKWEILPNGKKIGRYNCQKAQATFRGREYEVWYTMDIPISVGPWKLQGLPGAILEAKSKDGEVAFEAEEIQIPYTLTTELTFTTAPDDTHVTFEEYKKTPEKEAKKAADHITVFLQAAFLEKGMKDVKLEEPKYDLGFLLEKKYE